jgi:hypothetical protein
VTQREAKSLPLVVVAFDATLVEDPRAFNGAGDAAARMAA